MTILKGNKLCARKHNGDPRVPKEYDFKSQTFVTYFGCIENSISAIRKDADGPRR